MSTQSKRTYTRRTTRDRVVSLLEEAITLVKARCVEPIKGSAENIIEKSRVEYQKASHMKNVLEQSRLEFQKAIEMKKNANALLASTALAPEATVPVQEATEATEATVQEATEAPEATEATVQQTPLTQTLNTSLKKKKTCPGGPKAFNEFLKAKRPEVEAELGDVPYANVRARIAQLWKQSCTTTKTRKKTKTLVTPGRVNAVVPLPVSETPELPQTQLPQTQLPQTPQLSPVLEEPLSNVEYENLGMDDTLGMHKIVFEGKPYFMTDEDKGIFNRNSNTEPGSFVGYLRNGKIEFQEEPNQA